MCWKHYFRYRRHGDPSITHARGPQSTKPKAPSAAEVAALRVEVARLTAENEHLTAATKKAPRASAGGVARKNGRRR
jgi:hypothetical protein